MAEEAIDRPGCCGNGIPAFGYARTRGLYSMRCGWSVRGFWGGFESAPHTVGIVRYDMEIGASRLIRLRASLLPIAQRAERNVITRGEFLLGQSERTTQRPRA